MGKEIFERLLSFPQRGQIKIDFDLAKKKFHLSVPIFTSRTSLPQPIQSYIEARKNFTFKPYETSYQIQAGKVLLIQQFPFELEFQETLRQRTEDFWQMAKRCHEMLSEIALEEVYKNALHLDSHFEE